MGNPAEETFYHQNDLFNAKCRAVVKPLEHNFFWAQIAGSPGVNLSPETKQIINGARLALLKKGAVVINTARGELVEVNAVVAALKSGHLLGYGADVLEQEPPPKDHPLFACPNAILTPHIGSRTYESVARQATMAAQNLIAVLSGQKPIAQANQV